MVVVVDMYDMEKGKVVVALAMVYGLRGGRCNAHSPVAEERPGRPRVRPSSGFCSLATTVRFARRGEGKVTMTRPRVESGVGAGHRGLPTDCPEGRKAGPFEGGRALPIVARSIKLSLGKPAAVGLGLEVVD